MVNIITKFIGLLILIAYVNSKIYNGSLLVGTTGDYRPVSFLDKETNTYEGIDIELSQLYAKENNLKLKFIPTTWSTLLEDTMHDRFDFAICGITITENRSKNALMNIGYLSAGKTFLKI